MFTHTSDVELLVGVWSGQGGRRPGLYNFPLLFTNANRISHDYR